MLCLAFLLLIGVALLGEGLHFHIPKGYLYFAIAFSAGALYILRLMAKGPETHEPTPEETSEPPGSPLATGVASAAEKGA